MVSIQPKPKTGLEVGGKSCFLIFSNCFNPAEAEDGFRSSFNTPPIKVFVSFNPAEAEDGFRRSVQSVRRPLLPCFNPAEAEDGFRSVVTQLRGKLLKTCFNPAEAEDGFRRQLKLYQVLLVITFQSSRSRRRV